MKFAFANFYLNIPLKAEYFTRAKREFHFAKQNFTFLCKEKYFVANKAPALFARRGSYPRHCAFVYVIDSVKLFHCVLAKLGADGKAVIAGDLRVDYRAEIEDTEIARGCYIFG